MSPLAAERAFAPHLQSIVQFIPLSAFESEVVICAMAHDNLFLILQARGEREEGGEENEGGVAAVF
jgi:hypothetical protein